MKPLHKILVGLLLLFYSAPTLAQDAEMADTFRSDGKIYVVVAIILIILIGLFVYLFATDRKVSALEKRIGKRQN